MKIAAVVVTYNRLNLLKECIEALRNQTSKVDELIIVNNGSTDGTEEWLKEQNDITLITQANLGGAGGFFTGIKTAYEKGHDWIFCADDDVSIEDSNFLGKFLKYSHNFPQNTYAISCMQKYDDGSFFIMSQKFSKLSKKIINIPYDKKDFLIPTSLFSFAGVFIKREAVLEVGLPLKELFISYDDAEYAARICKKGLIFSGPSLVVNHHLIFNQGIINGFWRNRIYDSKSEWRMFYEKRNYFITLLSFERSIGVLIRIFYLFTRSTIYITLIGNNKFERYRTQYNAFIQAISNKYKNTTI